MTVSVNSFVSDIVGWATRNQALPRRSLPRLAGAVRKAIADLRARDDRMELRARDLGEHRHRATLSGPGQWLLSSRRHIWVIATTPDWQRGWSTVDSDEHIASLISWFFHFAAQYVARSRMANMVGSMALVHRAPLEFRYARQFTILRRNRNEGLSLEDVSQALGLRGQADGRRRGRDRLLASWGSLLNCLQPHIHRMVYQYLRALKLEENGHYEEAVTALDGVVTVALQFAREVLGWTSKRDATLQRLVGHEDARLLQRMYQLRCAFGAHPSCGKWWDFSEIYEYELDEFPEVITRLIRSTALLEQRNRTVETNPTSWSAWFDNNCHALWRSVWFDHVP